MKCFECGRDDEAPHAFDGDYYCEDCFYELFFICDDCRNTFLLEDREDDTDVCKTCYETAEEEGYCTYCDDVIEEGIIAPNNLRYCMSCFKNLFAMCPVCSLYSYKEEMKEGICVRCYERLIFEKNNEWFIAI